MTAKVFPHDLYHGTIAVYDSLIICWNPKLQNCFFNIFNLDSGREIGYFCNKGRGPGEFSSVNPVFQLFKKDGDLITILSPHSERKLMFWNISKSIKQSETIYDQIIEFENNRSNYNCIFYQNEDTLFAQVRSLFISEEEEEALPSYFEQQTSYGKDIIRDFHIYKEKRLINLKTHISPSDFFCSDDIIKPDGSKFVQAMWFLPQLNIVDTHTGKVEAFRIKKGVDFSFFKTDMKPLITYYLRIQVDDNYIYTVYVGKNTKDASNNGLLYNTIHLYDWYGNHLYELIVDRDFSTIWLDPVRNRLYTIDFDTDEVCYLILDELLKK